MSVSLRELCEIKIGALE